MHSMSIREARQKFSDLIAAAEHGESTVITRHGKHVAQVTPPEAGGGGPLPDLTDFRASIAVTGEPLSQTIQTSRHDARY